ncbi:CRISPR-associated protein Csx16 [Propionivibrio sp.]|uniref:CRISPR-associated protein Csx16 n=1 Tax=Propionivibrio sp. TaxID=2212460 RepID=UPI003BF31B10
MITWFVTRHPGAVAWAHQHGVVAPPEEGGSERIVDTIDPADVGLGDTVIGTLPVHLAAEICARGGRYFHIVMTVPTHRRGDELTPDDMVSFGATCREFIVFSSPVMPVAQTPASLPALGQGSHVCLVSDQHMANLLPILKRRPARVELVCTPEMLAPDRGLDRLARSLQRYGYGAAQITPHGAPPECSMDFHAARQFARQLREKLLLAHPTEPLTLNATGGTKALSSAFFMEFQGLEILYTDTQGGGYIRHMESATQPPEALGSLITSIDDYLHCQGYRITRSASDDEAWRQTVRGRRPLSGKLVEALSGRGQGPVGTLIGELNRRAQQVEELIYKAHIQGNLKSASAERKRTLLEKHVATTAIPDLRCPKAAATPLLDSIFAAGLLVRNGEGDPAFFSSLDALRYLGGGWLEEWAWLAASDCGVDDCRCGVFVQANDEGAAGNKDDNELDLVILHKNRLLIAECKTINWQGANGKQDILNKIDALGNHARGLYGRSLLVSARLLDDDARRRARAYGVTVLEAASLTGLKKQIRSWMGSKP